jgi:hypothetical protein
MTALRLPAPAADSLRGILAAIVLDQLGRNRPAKRGAPDHPDLLVTIPARAVTAAGGKIARAGRARKSPL